MQLSLMFSPAQSELEGDVIESSNMEQRVEGMEVAEALTKTRSELKGLKERWRTLSSLLDSEEYWIETVGVVSVCVCVCV